MDVYNKVKEILIKIKKQNMEISKNKDETLSLLETDKDISSLLLELDLNFDSLDDLEIVMDCEDAFNIKFPIPLEEFNIKFMFVGELIKYIESLLNEK